MARCSCSKACDCYLLDDGYDGTNISNNNSTFVRGIGEIFEPYSLDNIHDPNFIPPLAQAFKNKAFMAAGQVIFDGANFNTEGMYNTNLPDRVTVTHEGLYAIGFDVAFETAFNTSTTSFEYSAYITQHYGTGGVADCVRHRYFETTSIWPLTVRSTQSRILAFYVIPGDYFTLHTFSGIPTLSTQASMWICYV